MAPLEKTGTGSASFTRRIASQLQSETALPFCSFVRPWTVIILPGWGFVSCRGVCRVLEWKQDRRRTT